MKTLIRTFILFFCITGLASCYAGIPLKSGKSENNQTYEVSYLFEHDGVKVYRFLDQLLFIKTVYQTDNEKRLSNNFFLTASPLSNKL